DAARFISGHATTNYIKVRPTRGPGGTEIRVTGYATGGDCSFDRISIHFVDANGADTQLYEQPGGKIHFVSNLPSQIGLGSGKVQAITYSHSRFPPYCVRGVVARTPFTVTDGPGIFGFSPRKG